MELLVGVLEHGHSHASRHVDAFRLQRGSRVGDQFRLEGRVTSCLGDDLAECVVVLRHGRSSRGSIRNSYFDNLKIS